LSKIVIIVGSGRCGSHFLRDILSLHKDIKGTFENYFVSSILYKLGAGVHSTNEMLDVIKNNCDGNGLKHFTSICMSMGKEIEMVSEQLLSNSPKYMSILSFYENLNYHLFGNVKIIADKSHAYGAILPEILAELKEAKIINIVRDGVATARSMAIHSGYRKVVGHEILPEELPYMFCEGSLENLSDKNPTEEECFIWWKNYVETCFHYGNEIGPKKFLTIRYEDLAMGSADTFFKIAQFLDLEYELQWLDNANSITLPNAFYRQYQNFTKKRYNQIQSSGLEIQKMLGYYFPEN